MIPFFIFSFMCHVNKFAETDYVPSKEDVIALPLKAGFRDVTFQHNSSEYR